MKVNEGNLFRKIGWGHNAGTSMDGSRGATRKQRRAPKEEVIVKGRVNQHTFVLHGRAVKKGETMNQLDFLRKKKRMAIYAWGKTPEIYSANCV